MSKNGVPDPSVLQGETVWLNANVYMEAEKQFFYKFQETSLYSVSSKKNTYCMALVGQNDSGVLLVKNHPGCMPILEKGCIRDCHSLSKPTPMEMLKISPKKGKPSLAGEIAIVREKIHTFMHSEEYDGGFSITNLQKRIQKLEEDKAETLKKMERMNCTMEEILRRLNCLNVGGQNDQQSIVLEKPIENGVTDENLELFGSDEVTEKELNIKQEHLKAYQTKKAKKPVLVAKSCVVFDVKPWADETDLKEMESAVRKINVDGLKWGAAKFVPLAYGIKKLQVVAVVEDDKVSIDWLQESIEEIEDLVQSVDIASFNKL